MEGQEPPLVGLCGGDDADLTFHALVLARAARDGHRIGCRVTKANQRLAGDLPAGQGVRGQALGLAPFHRGDGADPTLVADLGVALELYDPVLSDPNYILGAGRAP
jgi:hypothetical protein